MPRVPILFQPLPRRWHLLTRTDLRRYVESLGAELEEWLLALYVDAALGLLSVETVGRGDVYSVPINFRHIIGRGIALNAAAFLLVHNHPSGDPRPSPADLKCTARLRRLSADLAMPLIDHFIIAGDKVEAMGWPD